MPYTKMILIPPRETKQLVQTNRSNLLGNLWATHNMDFESNKGAIRVSPRLWLNTTSLNNAPVAIKYFDTKIWAVAGTTIYGSGATPEQTFSADGSAGSPTNCSSDESDLELFNGVLVVSTTTSLWSKVSNGGGTGAWTERVTSEINAGNPHILNYFQKFDRLYFTDATCNVYSIPNSSWTVNSTPGVAGYSINLAPSAFAFAYFIMTMKSTRERIWIGVRDKNNPGSFGKIMEWDGIGSTAQEYKLKAQACMAIAIDYEHDIPFAMDSNGALLKWNGNGFSEVGRLPVGHSLLTKLNSDDNDRFIHPNGLQVTKEGTVLAFVNNLNSDGTYNENFNAGVYEFSPLSDGTYSCSHKYSLGYDGTTIRDYGQSRVSRVGALAPMNIYSEIAGRNGTYMLGATYYTSASASASGIFYDDSANIGSYKNGYFVTTWIHSQNIKDSWQKIVLKYRKLLDASNEIWVKYRLTEAAPSSDITITWYNSTTTFSTSTSLSAWAVGDEVEVIQGPGSGKCAHITAMTDLGGGVTEVELDEAFTGVVNTDTAKIRIQKWVKIGSVADQVSESKIFALGKVSERIQLKVAMQFLDNDELFETVIINNEHEKMV